MLLINESILKAIQYANNHHGNQVRKYSGLPYITHPLNVAITVQGCFSTKILEKNKLIEIALLHDIVEKTTVYISEIYKIFGKIVGNGLTLLTDKSKSTKEKHLINILKDKNRQKRTSEYNKQIYIAPLFIKFIKASDILDNIIDINLFEKDFSKIYIKEKIAQFNLFGYEIKNTNLQFYCKVKYFLDRAEKIANR